MIRWAAVRRKRRIASSPNSPLPVRLFLELAEQLYRQDRFANGALVIPPRTVGLAEL